MSTLPLTILAPTPQMLETLERWGIRRFHEMASLPPLGIAERLGAEGLRLRDRRAAKAIANCCRWWTRSISRTRSSWSIRWNCWSRWRLLARLINGLATRLGARGLATDELRLRLKLETGGARARNLRLPLPSLDTKAFLKLMQLDLEANPPAAPIVHLWMGVNPVKPQGKTTLNMMPPSTLTNAMKADDFPMNGRSTKAIAAQRSWRRWP